MYINQENYTSIKESLQPFGATLVAVSKTKPVEAIEALYALGHRDFGENYVQELVDKQAQLPADIRWHFIGHLQSNKVKYIAPFVHLIHGIDSLKLLTEVNKQGQKLNRKLNVLLQVHIAREETKYGFDESELLAPTLEESIPNLSHVQIQGLMGMASFSDDAELVRSEFRKLKDLFIALSEKEMANLQLQILSMGMSSDFKLALEEGSTMVRIGSSIFGNR
jgi:pyridoxal phosphate enzyme (YggS family)